MRKKFNHYRHAVIVVWGVVASVLFQRLTAI